MTVVTDRWNVNASGDWSTPGDWSTGSVPGNNNNAIISTATPQTITYSSGSDTVWGISVGADHFALTGGTLTVLTSATFQQAFNQTGGALAGGAFIFQSGATLTGGAAGPGTYLQLIGQSTIGNETLDGALLTNAGTVTQTAPVLAEGLGFDAAANFSLAQNPNGAWSYLSAGSLLSQTATTDGGELSGWYNGQSFPNSSEIIQNSAGTPVAFNSTVLPPGYLDLEADGSGDATLAFTAPTTGIYTFTGNFLGVDTAESAHAVAVVMNGVTLASGTIGSYGQSIAFNPTAQLTAGQTVYFTSDSGPGGNPNDNGTALSLAVTENAAFINNAGAVYNLTTDDGITGSPTSGVFYNEGLLEKTGGSGISVIDAEVENVGTVAINTGAIEFAGGTNSIGGAVVGNGMLDIGGNVVFRNGISLNVAKLGIGAGGTLTLGNNTTYNGTVTVTGGGTLDLLGHNLTLGGPVSFNDAVIDGGGTLTDTHATTLANVQFEGSTRVNNTGTMTESGPVQLGLQPGLAGEIINPFSYPNSSVNDAAVQTPDATFVATDLDYNLIPGVGDASSGDTTVSAFLDYNGQTDGATVSNPTVANASVGSTYFQMDGYIALTGGVTYTFLDSSDDGSILSINGTIVINDDGEHGNGALTQTFSVAQTGFYAIDVKYFDNDTGGASLLVQYSTGGSYTDLTSAVLYHGSPGSGSIVNAPGAVYNLTTDDGIAGAALGAQVVNQGLLEKTAGTGTSHIDVGVNNTGSIGVTSGTLELDGIGNALGGTISGDIALGGFTTLESNLHTTSATTLSLVAGATMAVGANLTLSGTLLAAPSSAILLNSHVLALNGSSALIGEPGQDVIVDPGTLANGGSMTLADVILTGVTLSNTGTVTQTGSVTLGGTSGAATLLNLVGGTYAVAGDVGIEMDGTTTSQVINRGLFEKTGGTGVSAIDTNFISTGTIGLATGTVELDGAVNQLAGSIVGAGTLAIGVGVSAMLQNALHANASTTLLLENNNTLTLTGNVTLGGLLDGSVSGTLNTITLAGDRLTLTGNSAIIGPDDYYDQEIDGPGALTNTGTLTLDAVVLGGLTLTNAGTIFDSAGGLLLGDSAGAATLLDTTTGVFDITTDVDLDIGNVGTSAVTNQGLFEKTGGSSTRVYANFTSTGTIAVTSGVVELDGASNTLGGSLSTGTLALGYNLTANLLNGFNVGANAVLSLDGSDLLTLAGNVTIAGSLIDESSNVIDLNAHGLTLTGPSFIDGYNGQVTVDGPGVLVNSGSLTLGNVVLGNLAASSTGNITETYWVTLGDSTGAATLTNAAAGVYNITADVGIDVGATAVSTFTNNGFLEKTGSTGTTNIYANFVNNGTLDATSGTIEFDGGGGFRGTITGAGTVGFSSGGTYTIYNATALSAAEIDLTNNSTLSLGSVTYQGFLDVNGSQVLLTGNAAVGSADIINTGIMLNGHNFRVTGSGGELYSSEVDNAGTFSTAGTFDSSNFTVGGGATWVNYRTVDEDGGSNALADAAGAGSLINAVGAIYDFTDDDSIYGYGATSGRISNAGLFEKTGGTSTTNIYAAFSSTGTVAVTSGSMEFDNGGTFHGALTGPGTIGFANNNQTYTIQSGTTLGIADLYVTNQATLLFAGAFDYAGDLNADYGTVSLGGNVTVAAFSIYAGEIELNGHTFSLTSPSLESAEVDGPGTLATTGTTTIGNFNVGAGAIWTNAGTVQESGNWVDLADNSGAGRLINAAGASYFFEDDYGFGSYGGTYGSILNQGLLEKVGGTNTSTVYAAINSTGTVEVASGTIEFDAGGTLGGTIEGPGTLGFASWNGLSQYTIAAGSKLTVANIYVAGGTALTFGGNTTYAGSLDVNNGTIVLDGNVSVGTFYMDYGSIELNGHTFSVTGATLDSPTVDGAGTLTTAGVTSTNNLDVGGGATWVNTGTVQQIGGWTYLDDGNGPGTLINNAGATYNIGDDSGIDGETGSVVINQGVFEKSGGTGTTEIRANFTSTSTVMVGSGVIELDGANNTLGGHVKGAVLALSGGSDTTLTASFTIDPLTTLLTEPGAAIDLASNIAFGGILDDEDYYGGVINLDGHTLTLTGSLLSSGVAQIAFEGPGVFLNHGTVMQLDDASFGGGITLSNAGTITQSGGWTNLGDGNGTGTLLNTGTGLYNITDDTGFYWGGSGNSSIINQGRFVKTGGTASTEIKVSFTNTGTVSILTGTTLELEGPNNALGGTIVGELALAGGSTTTLTTAFKANPSAILNIEDGASLYVGSNLTFSGILDDTPTYGSLIELDGYNCALTNNNTIEGVNYAVTVDGPGRISNSGSLTLGNATIGGGATLNNTGTVVESGYGITLGDNNGAGTLTNSGGAVFDMVADIGFYNSGTGSSISNQGLFEKTGSTGTSAINVSVTNTGTLDVATGTIELDGVGNMLGGKIIGGSTLALGGGSVTTLIAGFSIAANTTLEFENGATLLLGGNVTFAGTFGDTPFYGSQVNLKGYTLTLTGSSGIGSGGYQDAVDGPGTLTNSGSLTLDSALFGGGATLNNTARVTQSGSNTQLGDGNGGGTLNNAASGTFAIADDTGIGTGGSGAATIINYGLFEKSGGTGTSQISPSLLSSGTIDTLSGTLDFSGSSDQLSGTITGAGQTEFGGFAIITGTLTETATTLKFIGGLIDTGVIIANGGSIYVQQTPNGTGSYQIGNSGTLEFGSGTPSFESASFLASGGTLAVDVANGFQALIKGFAAGDAIDLTGVALSSVTGLGYANGVLSVNTTNGTDTLNFSGSYSVANFTTIADGSGNGTDLLFHA